MTSGAPPRLDPRPARGGRTRLAGQPAAIVQEGMVSLHHTFTIEIAAGGELHATRSQSTRKFELDQDGQPLARLLHKFIEVRDTVAVEVLDPQNTELGAGHRGGHRHGREFARRSD